MMASFLLVLPVFFIIALGKFLRHILLPMDELWSGMGKLCYHVLFPAFLFFRVSTIDFSVVPLNLYAFSLLGGLAITLIMSIIFALLVCRNRAGVTSVVQGAVRHNTFIGLVIATQMLGDFGASIGALATAILVPLVSTSTVVGFILYVGDRGKNKLALIMKEVMRNPMLVSIVIGILVNYFGLSHDVLFYEISKLLSGATLPIVLLCIGAGLRFHNLRSHLPACFVAILCKMVIFPVSVYLLCVYFGLSDSIILVATIFAIAPTAPTAYIIAREMGGDADLMAVITSVQTGLALFLYPLLFILLGL